MSARLPLGIVRIVKTTAAIRMMPSNPRRNSISTRVAIQADRLSRPREASAAGSAAGNADRGGSAIRSSPGWRPEQRSAALAVTAYVTRLEAQLHTGHALVRLQQRVDRRVV